MTRSTEIGAQLVEQGWVVVRLSNPNVVFDIRTLLLDELRREAGDREITLEDYHRLGYDDARHTAVQARLTQTFRERKLGRALVEAELELFKTLIGPDLDVQKSPYLRITRPGATQDNVGYHRDTFYGDSPWAINISIPFVDVPASAALRMLTGSHVLPESAFTTTKRESETVAKGSVRHQLGFVYAPKVMDPAQTADMTPVALKLGEAVVFSGAIVHGAVSNDGPTCRWTSDVRLINSLAPANPVQKQGYYEPLARSASARIGAAYTEANELPEKAA